MAKANTKIIISTERKCYGTFNLDYDYKNARIVAHGNKKFSPRIGILSFEDANIEVKIEFTKIQWELFIKEMRHIKWEDKIHFGQC